MMVRTASPALEEKFPGHEVAVADVLRPGTPNGQQTDIDGFVNVRKTTALRVHSRGVSSHTDSLKKPSTKGPQ